MMSNQYIPSSALFFFKIHPLMLINFLQGWFNFIMVGLQFAFVFLQHGQLKFQFILFLHQLMQRFTLFVGFEELFKFIMLFFPIFTILVCFLDMLCYSVMQFLSFFFFHRLLHLSILFCFFLFFQTLFLFYFVHMDFKFLIIFMNILQLLLCFFSFRVIW